MGRRFTIDTYIDGKYGGLTTQVRKNSRRLERERSLRTESPPRPIALGSFPEGRTSHTEGIPSVIPMKDLYDWVILAVPYTSSRTRDVAFFNTNLFDKASNNDMIARNLRKNSSRGGVTPINASYGSPQQSWNIKGGRGNGVFPEGDPAETVMLDGDNGATVSTSISPRPCLWMIVYLEDIGYDIIPYSTFISEPTSSIFNHWYVKTSTGQIGVIVREGSFTDREFNVWYVKDFVGGFGIGKNKFPVVGNTPDLEIELVGGAGGLDGRLTGSYLITSSDWMIAQGKVTVSDISHYSWILSRADFLRLNENHGNIAFHEMHEGYYFLRLRSSQIQMSGAREIGNTRSKTIEVSLFYI